MKKIKTICLLIIITVSLFFSSCSMPVDLRDRAIVQAMGIDYEDGEYKITLQEYLPENSGTSDAAGGEGSQSLYVTSYGKTLFDAIKNAEAKDGNQIFYGHSRLYLIGEEAAKKGLFQIVEFMNSNYQLSLNSSVMLAEGTAEKILHTRLFSGVVPDISIERIEGCGKAPDVTVIDVLRTMYNSEGSCCLPLISPDGEEEIKIERGVVFRDQKPHIWLNSEETMGLTWLEGNISDAVMITHEQHQTVSVNIVSEDTNLNMETKNGEVYLNVAVSAKGNISEIGVIHDEEIKEEHVKRVEKEIEEQIKAQIKKSFKTIVTEGACDLFYLKQRLKNTDKNLYQKQKEQPLSSWLPQIKLNVSADFSIRHSGIQVR